MMRQFQPSALSNPAAYGDGWSWTPAGALYSAYQWATGPDEDESVTDPTLPDSPSYVPPTAPGGAAPDAPGAPYPLTQRPWFWPVVIVGGAVALSAGIIYWPKSGQQQPVTAAGA